MIVPGRDIRNYRAENIKRGFLADFLLTFHIHSDLIERNMPGTFNHNLHAPNAATFNQFSQNIQLAELGGIRGIGETAGPEAVAERNRDIVFDQNIQNLIPMLIKRIFASVLHHPFGHDRAAA
jgi:hypothetical protein